MDGVILGVRLGDRRSLKLPPELHPELADPLLLSRKLISASFAHFRFNKELILVISPSSPASLHSIFKMALCAVFTFFILKKTRILFSLFCWRKTRSWSPHFIGEVSLISVIQSAISSSTCILHHFLSFWFEIFLWPTHITTLCNEHWLDHISVYLTYIFVQHFCMDSRYQSFHKKWKLC